MRKKLLSVTLISALLIGTCSIALAADTKDETTGSGLKSYGRIVYQNGGDAVVIDSEDFHMLADRLDLFKRGVADQLNSINTYFTTEAGLSLKTDEGIRVVHTRPSGESAVDPKEIDFDTLLEGIAASQSVPDDVSSASADNLTAGTAAWGDGHLMLGTGADNQKFYQNGYDEAYKKVSGQVGSVDFLQYGGELSTRKDDTGYLGPCDISIPNKDVWLLLPGNVSAKAEFTPGPSARTDGTYISMRLYRKDPNLPETATRTLHLPKGDKTSGHAAPWYLLYLK